jgi:hypothetical protein
MNDAVWKFRQFEEPSLSYMKAKPVETRGGWNVRRDERFAKLIDSGLVQPGELLVGGDESEVVYGYVSEDYGILVDGLRHESPNLAAMAASGSDAVDGWTYWRVHQVGRSDLTLAELRESKVD